MSKYQKENDVIASTLARSGFAIERCSRYWPRNLWVYSNGNYFTERAHGRMGNGGDVIIGSSFALISDYIFYLKQEKRNIDTIHAESIYGRKAYNVPSPINHNGTMIYHIDLSCLVIDPKKKIMVDRYYYSAYDPIALDEWFSWIQRETGYEMVFLPENNTESQFFRCNALVIDDYAFSNSNTPAFNGLLKDLGMKVSSIPIQYLPEMSGSIRCATNIKKRSVAFEELADCEEIESEPA